jgi:uncharacterized protein YwgA
MESKPTLRDYVLAIIKLGSKGGEFRYKTKIHKIVFLITQEFGLKMASFIPYHFGPWSPEVDDVLDELIGEELLKLDVATREEIDGAKHTGKVYSFRITKSGELETRRALALIPPEIRRRIEELAKWDLWRLIGYVYVRYPHYATHSAIADDELRVTQDR